MKVAIPVEDKNMKSSISEHFGRTEYFLIYDMNSKEENFVKNTAANSSGGAGIEAAQIVLDQRIDTLIVPRLGNNAGEVLKKENIKLFKNESNSIETTLKALEEGELSSLEKIHPGFHNHGGN
jgi:predicted Fe-Mo cluster-binding NifX family protein